MLVEPKKILIRGVNWIGDAVLTMPAIRAIRKAFPNAHISLLAKPWVSELFKGSPDINEIILYENKFNSVIGKLKLASILRQKRFDTAILLQNAFDAAIIAWLSGIPKRIGYSRDFRRLLLTKAIPFKKTVASCKLQVASKENSTNSLLAKEHQVYYYLNLLKESLNIESEDIEPSIYLKKEEIHEARNLIHLSFVTKPALSLTKGHSSLLVGINPGATYGSAKRWPPERFTELIHRIINELNGRVVLFGSKSELGIANEITPSLTLPPRGGGQGWRGHILNLAGKTSLRQLSALISQCDAFITNDSGPMHIASAMFVPTVALFGSTDPKATCPLGKGHKVIYKGLLCSPCLKRECPEGYPKCMEEIATADVFNALRDVLPKEKAVFLDRDGTLIEDVGYLNNFSNLRILPEVSEGLQRLKSAGLKLVGITNQSGIARGTVDEEFVKESNTYLQKTLGIDAFYYCPHHPDDNCLCRKPEILLLQKAKLEHGLDLKNSYVIGDKEIDILLAKNAGAKGILVLTGQDKESNDADFVAKDFKDAVDWILKKDKSG